MWVIVNILRCTITDMIYSICKCILGPVSLRVITILNIYWTNVYRLNTREIRQDMLRTTIASTMEFTSRGNPSGPATTTQVTVQMIHCGFQRLKAHYYSPPAPSKSRITPRLSSCRHRPVRQYLTARKLQSYNDWSVSFECKNNCLNTSWR